MPDDLSIQAAVDVSGLDGMEDVRLQYDFQATMDVARLEEIVPQKLDTIEKNAFDFTASPTRYTDPRIA